ncbi:uncharacterized protein SCHCODRAFT_02723491 [Schizophyllum commune H4-8]|uniref:Uncharacterized protein n=1 Tax=Schizophyllum commune (strain H4-8 / FGSC 9210) TaxID=578458 RepID=D8PYE5_SCHCM|nr:uncharacterized protein SCHCODRAFT_02723491 [Schizophyllum commune H4-8]KAI5895921.1 hypothetical protein SCHCODRAFT_02723491 [Schizophyllum commune H4-8]
MPLRARRLLLALRYLGYLTTLSDDPLARLALAKSFRLARNMFPCWITDLQHVLKSYVPAQQRLLVRLHDRHILAGLQTAVERPADRLAAAQLQTMSRLDLWNAHALGKCRGHAALMNLRAGFLRRLDELGLQREPHPDDHWDLRLIWWLAEHKRDDVRTSWAHFVYRVLAVFDAVPMFIVPRYKKRVVT